LVASTILEDSRDQRYRTDFIGLWDKKQKIGLLTNLTIYIRGRMISKSLRSPHSDGSNDGDDSSRDDVMITDEAPLLLVPTDNSSINMSKRGRSVVASIGVPATGTSLATAVRHIDYKSSVTQAAPSCSCCRNVWLRRLFCVDIQRRWVRWNIRACFIIFLIIVLWKPIVQYRWDVIWWPWWRPSSSNHFPTIFPIDHTTRQTVNDIVSMQLLPWNNSNGIQLNALERLLATTERPWLPLVIINGSLWVNEKRWHQILYETDNPDLTSDRGITAADILVRLLRQDAAAIKANVPNYRPLPNVYMMVTHYSITSVT
jgi:hypothetical protein